MLEMRLLDKDMIRDDEVKVIKGGLHLITHQNQWSISLVEVKQR